MFIFYLFCLILGGGLLGFSLFSGGDADAHADGDLHLDAHSDIELLDSGADITDIEVSADTHLVPHAEAADAIKLISFRNIIYFTAFFGLTGTLFTVLSFSAIVSFISSLVLGTFSAGFGYKLMKYLKSSESGEAISIHSLVGKKAVVILPVTKTKKGKIILECSSQTIELVAIVSDSSLDDEFKLKEEVLIIDIKSNVAYIIKADF